MNGNRLLEWLLAYKLYVSFYAMISMAYLTILFQLRDIMFKFDGYMTAITVTLLVGFVFRLLYVDRANWLHSNYKIIVVGEDKCRAMIDFCKKNRILCTYYMSPSRDVCVVYFVYRDDLALAHLAN